jgi:hypothetical protein
MNPIQDSLLPGEKVLWSGQPKQGLLLTWFDWIAVPFGILWVGFAAMFGVIALANGGPADAIITAVFFVGFGSLLFFGRFVADAWIRRKTFYATTDRRALIIRQWPSRALISLDLKQTADFRLYENRGQRGTISFGARSLLELAQWNPWMPSLSKAPKFLAIKDAGRVFNLIQEVRGRP